jgi:hypothetical protein
MRILPWVGQDPFELADGFFTEHMFDFFGIFVDVIRGIPSFVGKIKFPESMVSYDPTGVFPTFGSKAHPLFK